MGEKEATVIAVKLVQRGDSPLVSRSQARKLLSNLDVLTSVILDFSLVESIGPSFADEIFRVFCNRHPEIKIVPINTTPEVKQMISRAQ